MIFTISTLDTGNVPAGTTTLLKRVTSFSPDIASKDQFRDRNSGVQKRRQRGRRTMGCKLVVEVLDSELEDLFQVLGNSSKDDSDPIFLWWNMGTVASPDYAQIWLKPSGTWTTRLYGWVLNPKIDATRGKWFKISFEVTSAWESTTA